jgi:hypothetical protein
MKKRRAVPAATIPDWTHAGKSPGVLTFFESIALAGLEDQRIRLSAIDQRKLLGVVVFGRRPITVHKDGTVECTVDTGFGRDSDTAVWSANTIRLAADAGQQLCPKTSGPGYFNYGSE